MKITKLQKEAMINDRSARITVEITVYPEDLDQIEYDGFDLFPDELIMDLLSTVSRKYRNSIIKGRIDQSMASVIKTSSIV